MNLRKIALSLIPLVALAVLAAACDGGEAALTTTSSLITGSGDGTSTTTVAVPDDQTSTTLVGQVVASYEIVAREPGTDGETVYVVIPPGTYTDVDIENFLGELYDSGTATYGAEIFDDAAAVDCLSQGGGRSDAGRGRADRAASLCEPRRGDDHSVPGPVRRIR